MDQDVKYYASCCKSKEGYSMRSKTIKIITFIVILISICSIYTNGKISSKDERAKFYYNLGVDYDDIGRYEEALEAYNKAIKIKPDYHEAWSNKGNALRKLGRYNEALEACNKAIEIKPDHNEAWLNKGNALVNLDRYYEALEAFNKAIEIIPDYFEAWYNKGVVLAKIGRRSPYSMRENHRVSTCRSRSLVQQRACSFKFKPI
jgi:tetratricopeptide (TPR) repeat protein